MQIKSDKENEKKPGFFSKLWKSIMSDLVATSLYISLPIILYTWYVLFPDDYIWLLLIGIGIVGAFGMVTDGKLFELLKDMIRVFYVSIGLVTGVWFIAAPIEIEESRMSLKPYITQVRANKQKSDFIIDSKLPFESGINVAFNGAHQYDALFSDTEHFEEFTLEAVKSCSIYWMKGISCEVNIEITHRDSAEVLFTQILNNSVYPQKLKIEMVELMYYNLEETALEKRNHDTIKLVIDTKPPLVCGKKFDVYLNGNQYDITEIGRTLYVVTEATRLKPLSSVTLSNCKIIKPKTDTMKIKPPVVISIDEKHASAIKKLVHTINRLTNENSLFKNKKTNYASALNEANERVNTLAAIIKKQEEQLKDVRIAEAKYNELKEIMSVIMSKTNINIPSNLIIVEETKETISLKEVLKKVSTPVVVNLKPLVTPLKIKNNKEHIQRLLYVLRALNRMHSNPTKLINTPTLDDLSAIKVSDAQVGNAKQIIYRIDKSIDIIIQIHAKIWNINPEKFRDVIRTTIGV